MMQIEGHSYPLLLYAGPFVLWIVFFMLGIWCATHPRTYSIFYPLLLTIVGYLLSVIECMVYLPINGGGLGIKLSSFIFSSGVILLLFSEKVENKFSESRLTRPVVYIGEISFGIYLLHMYVRTALNHVSHTESWLFDWATTLILSIGLIYLLKITLPKTFITKYLGIR